MRKWFQRVKDQGCRTISRSFVPLEGEQVWEYVCTASDFLSANSHIVKFTTPDGSALVPYNHPDATPILIREFIRNPVFVEPLLQRWDVEMRAPVNSADLLVQRCSSCDRRVVIDGVHRVVWIGVRGSPSAELRIS